MKNPPSTHSVLMRYILWIFGFTGSEWFYYGKPVWGTIYFFTLGILGIGWFLHLFLITSMAREAGLWFTEGKSIIIARILLTFLGLFGINRFYMGEWFSGLLYLFTLVFSESAIFIISGHSTIRSRLLMHLRG